MPGGNCCFPQCTVSRYVIHNDRYLFKITTRNAPFYAKWRGDMINIVKQYREIDATFTQKAESGKKYICDRHFLPTDIQTNGEWVYNWFYSVDPFSMRARPTWRYEVIIFYRTTSSWDNRKTRCTMVVLLMCWCWCTPSLLWSYWLVCPLSLPTGREAEVFWSPTKVEGTYEISPVSR